MIVEWSLLADAECFFAIIGGNTEAPDRGDWWLLALDSVTLVFVTGAFLSCFKAALRSLLSDFIVSFSTFISVLQLLYIWEKLLFVVDIRKLLYSYSICLRCSCDWVSNRDSLLAKSSFILLNSASSWVVFWFGADWFLLVASISRLNSASLSLIVRFCVSILDACSPKVASRFSRLFSRSLKRLSFCSRSFRAVSSSFSFDDSSRCCLSSFGSDDCGGERFADFNRHLSLLIKATKN